MKCSKCGVENVQNSQICLNCRTVLQNSQIEQQNFNQSFKDQVQYNQQTMDQQNKKSYTGIVVVCIILGVVALLTILIIIIFSMIFNNNDKPLLNNNSNIVDKAKEATVEASATAYVKAVELSIMYAMLEDDANFCTQYTAEVIKENGNANGINPKKLVKAVGAEGCKELEISHRGDLPDEAIVNVSNGLVTTAILTFDDYVIEYENGQSKVS